MNLPYLKLSYLIFIFVISFSLTSQNEPKWVAPLDIPIQLSGTFGELRNNHFHAGLDIRTQGRQGGFSQDPCEFYRQSSSKYDIPTMLMALSASDMKAD